MLVSTVKQVLKADDGDTLHAFKGQVKTVWKRRTGTSDGGRDWAVQNLLCREGESTVEVVLWNQEPLRADFEGETIYIESEDGKGLSAIDHEWKGKTKRQLKVDQCCTVSRGEMKRSEQNANYDPKELAQARTNAGRIMNYAEAHRFSGRAANAMLLAFRGAAYVAASLEKESKLFATPELINLMTLGIYGSLERSGMIDAMPVGALPVKSASKPAPEDPAEPEPERAIGVSDDETTTAPAEIDDVPF